MTISKFCVHCRSVVEAPHDCPVVRRKRNRNRGGRPRDRSRAGRKRRAEMMARYGWRCAGILPSGERCPATDELAEHHINSDPMDNRDANRVPLCAECHRREQDNPDAEFAFPV